MAITSGLTLLQKLQKLFGARAVSDMMGRTTNVQTLAQGQNNPFALSFSKKYLKKNPDGVEEASKVIMENMQFAFGNKNAQQMKNFQNNVDTLFEIKFPPAKAEAQILDLSTKKQVTGKGIDSLKNKMGLPEGVSPDSPMGKILTSQNKLKKMSQELNNLGAKTYSAPEEGRRRAVMRQILLRDNRLNLPENIRDSLDNFKDLQRGGDESMDPLALFMKYYKRDNDKLDKLDDISRESKDAIDAADNFLVKDDTIELLDKKPMVRESLDDEAVELEETKDLGDQLKDYDGDPDGLAEGGRIGFAGGGIKDLIKKLNKKFGKGTVTTAENMELSPNVLQKKMFEDFNKRNRKLTEEEYEDLVAEYGEGVPQLETVADAKKFVKGQKAYEEAMYRDYKAGKLDPVAGEETPARKKFLQQRAEEAEMSGDSRLFTPDDADELTMLETKELAPQMYERMQLKIKYPGLTEDLIQKIMIDDNPQRKAELLATLDEAFKMMDKGMSSDEILNAVKNTPRTKQADGGLNYLMGL